MNIKIFLSLNRSTQFVLQLFMTIYSALWDTGCDKIFRMMHCFLQCFIYFFTSLSLCIGENYQITFISACSNPVVSSYGCGHKIVVHVASYFKSLHVYVDYIRKSQSTCIRPQDIQRELDTRFAEVQFWYFCFSQSLSLSLSFSLSP